MAGRPCYVDKARRAIAPLPAAQIEPLASGLWRVSLMLQRRTQGAKLYYSWSHFDGTFLDIERFCHAYKDDPEAALAYWFDYSLEPEAAPATLNLSLEDLDL